MLTGNTVKSGVSAPSPLVHDEEVSRVSLAFLRLRGSYGSRTGAAVNATIAGTQGNLPLNKHREILWQRFRRLIALLMSVRTPLAGLLARVRASSRTTSSKNVLLGELLHLIVRATCRLDGMPSPTKTSCTG